MPTRFRSLLAAKEDNFKARSFCNFSKQSSIHFLLLFSIPSSPRNQNLHKPTFMSSFRMAKRLQPAKKALKRFANSFQWKLRRFSLSEAIKTIKTNTKRLIAYCTTHLLVPFNKRSITRPSYLHRPYRNFYQSHTNKSELSAIYIDQLYASGSETHAESSDRGKAVVDEKAMPSRKGEARERSLLYSIEDAWREAVAKSPQLRPVDERAEEFIHKFHQDMKLQKERSILEFEERLARSA